MGLKQNKLPILIIVIAITILVIIYGVSIYQYYNYKIMHPNTIRYCFDKDSIQKIYNCITYSGLAIEMNVNHQLSIKDVPTFCKDIPEEPFTGKILNDKIFSDWVSFTRFSKKDLCYIHLMDFSFYPNYEKGIPDKNGSMVPATVNNYSEKMQVCNSFKGDRKKELCLVYGFEDIDEVCRLYPLDDCVGRCNIIKDENIKSLCLNMNFLCKYFDKDKQFCIPKK